ncbi:hypothetical protein LTSEINV_6578 [Salmonella enterica subsp. enterica serovar Inverness str. R8-3668]|nr:hypothetical protein LTSEINV_6578 [Salmonella enterica subsp. enterica serovar Inverness str. R8-3668]
MSVLPATAFHSGPLATTATGVPVNGFATAAVAVAGLTGVTVEGAGVLTSGFPPTGDGDAGTG